MFPRSCADILEKTCSILALDNYTCNSENCIDLRLGFDDAIPIDMLPRERRHALRRSFDEFGSYPSCQRSLVCEARVLPFLDHDRLFISLTERQAY